jgi:predicted RNase H-like HicB family nuclease
MEAIQFTIDYEQEGDGRWIAEVVELPGALVYGQTLSAAIARVKALALRVVAERLEHGEELPTWMSITFAEAS